jgi:uncharacterized protein (TIGR01777 family)
MNTASTILITGGTGLIGKALTVALLERGFHVIILTRRPAKQKNNHPLLTYAAWNAVEKTINNDAIAKADYIIHLAGASLAKKRWTEKRKQKIISSRVDSGKLIVESLINIPNKVKAVISASATGWYGTDSLSFGEGRGEVFTETDPAANDFLGQTCRQWEAAIEPVSFLKKRLVKFRIGIVLSNEGGALKEFKKPLRFGIATILGSGKQIISWIHIDDLVRLFLYALDNENLSGTFNAVAPNPVTNKQLILQIAEKQRGRFCIPIHVPFLALKIFLGEMIMEALKSTTVSCKKIQEAGFIFQYPTIEKTIQQLGGQKFT